ncbi:MAG TPA: type I methionyl aminopeptidase [Calditrichaeota bacterium]|nr:type I methionyl aminopeptidase [Calditrichota bacterium]
MIYIKSEEEIAKIEKSNQIVAETLQFIEKFIEPGVDTKTLNEEIENFIVKKKARPAFKGLYGFPAAACISVNDEVVHGIPGKRKLKKGDIVGIDVGVELNNYYGDAAKTFCVGAVKPEWEKLCIVTQQCLMLGIEQCIAGNKVGDISAAIQSHAEKNGLSVVRDLVGHGVGIKPHEDPQIPNFGEKGKGPKLKPGMVLAIEPMINLGGYQVYTADDNWTVKTADGKPSAHYEHSVAIMNDGVIILSKAY